MKEQLQKLRDALLEHVPRKNYSPAQKAAKTKRAAIAGCVISVLLLVVLVVALFPVTDVQIVSNDSHYTDQELLDALDHIFLLVRNLRQDLNFQRYHYLLRTRLLGQNFQQEQTLCYLIRHLQDLVILPFLLNCHRHQ